MSKKYGNYDGERSCHKSGSETCVCVTDAENAYRPMYKDSRELGLNRPWPLSNVMLCASVEDQVSSDYRMPVLFRSPAAQYGVSVEPMLGPVDLSRWIGPNKECDYYAHNPSERGGIQSDISLS